MTRETMQSTESSHHAVPLAQSTETESFSARPSEADAARAAHRRKSREPHGTHCSGAR